MEKRKVAIIGGGAAGMAAAIEAAKNGAEVTIYEHTDRLGKKILSTGNGKCNLGNYDLKPEYYYSHCMERVSSCLERFTTGDTIAFFHELGLCVKEKNGYIYPLAEQAAVVLDVLRFAVEQYGIRVLYEAKVNRICRKKVSGGQEKLCIETDKDSAFYHCVILACGSKAAPKTGSDGSGFELAKMLGHKIVPVLPSLVQLRCSDSFCKAIAGIRAEADIHIYAGQKLISKESGELQLTDYGISGIPVFQLSGAVNRYLYEAEHKKVGGKQTTAPSLVARINFLPHMDEKTFEQMIQDRCRDHRGRTHLTVEEFFTGILNKKLMMQFIRLAGLQPAASAAGVKTEQLCKVFTLCRSFEMHITGSNGFDNAQVCTGGVDVAEVTDQLESVKLKNVYFAGEILDVDGRCGGYNLQWAWTSGVIAGRAAAK